MTKSTIVSLEQTASWLGDKVTLLQKRPKAPNLLEVDAIYMGLNTDTNEFYVELNGEEKLLTINGEYSAVIKSNGKERLILNKKSFEKNISRSDITRFLHDDVSLILKDSKDPIQGHLCYMSKDKESFYFKPEDELVSQGYNLNEVEAISKNGLKYLFD
ncbi:MAG: hypothetical protein ACMXX9_00200 [Candidatus Woesearchaeota archaeon]